MVVHEVQWNKGIQVCKFHKPEAATIMNNKAMSEQRYMYAIKPEYDNGNKGLAGSPGD